MTKKKPKPYPKMLASEGAEPGSITWGLGADGRFYVSTAARWVITNELVIPEEVRERLREPLPVAPSGPDFVGDHEARGGAGLVMVLASIVVGAWVLFVATAFGRELLIRTELFDRDGADVWFLGAIAGNASWIALGGALNLAYWIGTLILGGVST